MELASPKSGGWVGGWGPREEPMLWFKFRDHFMAELLPAWERLVFCVIQAFSWLYEAHPHHRSHYAAVWQIAEERREAKSKGERESYSQLNTEFQRIAGGEKKAFFNEQC